MHLVLADIFEVWKQRVTEGVEILRWLYHHLIIMKQNISFLSKRPRAPPKKYNSTAGRGRVMLKLLQHIKKGENTNTVTIQTIFERYIHTYIQITHEIYLQNNTNRGSQIMEGDLGL